MLFTDALGREIPISFEMYDTWEQMVKHIREAFSNNPAVLDRRFDLTHSGGDLNATNWDEIVELGMRVFMEMDGEADIYAVLPKNREK